MNSKFIPLTIIIVSILVFSTVFTACKNDIDTINKITEVQDLPTFDLTGLETVYSDSGIIKLKIYAPKLVRYEKREIPCDIYEKGLFVEFYNRSMLVSGTLRCNYAKYSIKEELWEAKSNVEINNSDNNEKINTEQLFWDMKAERIYSDKFVRITTEDEILYGEGFESNQEFTNWKIIKPTGSIKIKDE
ncbi:MAG: LPS export ABC transporter periplasmic protein LptC [Bacteroidota bacterium]|nr:LPS export ABC transporter periplasmic protein LptC [Bacteroidales bacterium]MDI9535389.1 LPS export ABC transporter periplasmic protein LptC [Bacteroidota bacterium]NLP19657.1 LPS export ABC transporter periplasmic protein LptC [Bacteroidales bacterium]HNY43543.1 LPS export ABC transporter periplasmic protein LptC [Bacteroidales bacterium]HOE38089.1 LPS export ABC transporter periplasmic protein LptC [Bacteroidales bacterium]